MQGSGQSLGPGIGNCPKRQITSYRGQRHKIQKALENHCIKNLKNIRYRRPHGGVLFCKLFQTSSFPIIKCRVSFEDIYMLTPRACIYKWQQQGCSYLSVFGCCCFRFINLFIFFFKLITFSSYVVISLCTFNLV